ncbi:hypothetical protein SESBI_45467 [Sesbania bispinosa]|nr:hypothetical protein SESBI_45467 [Sesbania bispinosa]
MGGGTIIYDPRHPIEEVMYHKFTKYIKYGRQRRSYHLLLHRENFAAKMGKHPLTLISLL